MLVSRLTIPAVVLLLTTFAINFISCNGLPETNSSSASSALDHVKVKSSNQTRPGEPTALTSNSTTSLSPQQGWDASARLKYIALFALKLPLYIPLWTFFAYAALEHELCAFYELGEWLNFDYKHDTCWKYSERLFPYSPEEVAQTLGEPLPTGVAAVHKYGVYALKVLRYHATMLLFAVLFSPLYLMKALGQLTASTTIGRLLDAYIIKLLPWSLLEGYFFLAAIFNIR